MKKVLLIVVIVSALFLTACSAAQGAAQGLVGLPDEGRLLILSLVTAAVTWVLLKASDLFKIELSGYANAAAAGLAPIVVAVVEHFLGLIPPAFDNIVLTIIHLVVLLVGSLGTFFLFKRKAPSIR